MLIILTSQVQIQCDIPKQDPLRDMKLELLHQYSVPPTKEAKGLKYSVNSFTIKFALIPNFIFVFAE
jgi:histone-lysine N-methyltransferase SETD3